MKLRLHVKRLNARSRKLFWTDAVRAVDVIEREMTDAARATGLSDAEVSDDRVKHAIEVPGYIFGLPTGQVGNTVQFLWDTRTGRQDLDGAADWFKRLVYGKSKGAKR